MKLASWRLALLTMVAGGYLSACAQNVPDIDRTGPDKVDKAHFLNDDEWYYRQTIIDTDQVGSSGGIGMFEAFEGSLKRIRWTITEDALIAWSTQEAAVGMYDGQLDPEGRRVGVVAMFPIKSHFDVQRSYNAATGEQTNVISEATSDRHWYERKYMRVDWSRNLADSDFSIAGAVMGTFLGQLNASSRAVPQQDGYIDPDRTRFIDVDPDREGIEYLDTVTEYYYAPDVYACYDTYGFDTVFNCEAGTVRMRNSFLKVPDTKTYLPMDYLDTDYLEDENGKKIYTARVIDLDLNMLFYTECDEAAKNYMRDEFGYEKEDFCRPATFDYHQRFGYFRTETTAYDPDFGANYEEQRIYYANRWNIWQTMIAEDGSPLPMSERIPKPIVYYTNAEYPLDMWRAAQEVADQWDGAFTQAAALGKGVPESEIRDLLMEHYGSDKMFEIRWNSCSAPKLQEWFDAGYGAADGADRLNVAQLKDEFQEKWGGNNLEAAVWASTHDARTRFCAALEYGTELRAQNAFSYERVGDLRYSFFNWVDEEVPWLGYGPSAADPVSGEIISGNANFAGAAIRTYGPHAADIIQYLNGELDQEEIAHGDHIREHLKNVRDGIHEQRQSLSPEGKRELARRAGRDPLKASATNFERIPNLNELPNDFLRHGREKIAADALRYSIANVNARAADTRALEFYDQPRVRQVMLADQNLQLLVEATAIDKFGPQYTDEDFARAFAIVQSPGLEMTRTNRRINAFARESIMLRDHLDTALDSLVTYSGVQYAFKGKSRKEIADHFIQKMFVGTQLHEVGHTVGLRHNFSASTDTMNYHDEYWDIQRKIAAGEITEDERWVITGDLAKEIAGEDAEYVSEAEFRLASVMDYTGDLTGRFAGLGKYDYAAINFAYGEVVEQFKEDAELAAEFGPEAKLINYYDTLIWLNDYSMLPIIMSGSSLGTPEAIQRGINVITDGREYIPISTAKEQYRNGLKVNSNNWKEGVLSNSALPWQDRAVPYNFCSDEYRGLSLGCDLWDWGTSQREIVNHNFNTYRVMQPFRRYNRGRTNRGYENLSAYAGWVARTLSAVEQPFRYYSYYQWYDLGAYTDDLRDASIDAVNFYAEIMGMPQPGRYCMYNTANTTGVISPEWYYDLTNTYIPAAWTQDNGTCPSYIDIPKGVGQFYGYEFTDEYEYRIERVGTFVDKSIATQALFQINSNYVDSNFFTDHRATNVTYWTLFQNEMLGFMRGTIMGDYTGFSSVYNPVGGVGIQAPKLIDPASFGLGKPNEQDSMSRIYTPVSFSHKLNMVIGGMLYNHTWLDRNTDFGQYIKIAVSNDESQVYPDDAVVHEFVHPVTQQVYSAVQSPDNNSVAVELVEWANDLRSNYLNAKAARDAATPGSEAYGTAQANMEFRSQQLEDVVGRMDQIRWVYEAIGADGLR